MANTIQIKRSSTAGSAPEAGDLAQGELALNLPDRKLYTKDASNAVVQLNPVLDGFRNRIINGDMRIDQRNAGAAVTASGAFPVDRFAVGNNTDGAFSAQQDSSAPTGFVNSLKFTTTTADGTIAASQDISLQQKIEGTNISDLAWGTANAQSVTLSFWVRSSLTGTFSGAIANSAYNRSYPFTYTISVADTWEYKTITIPGDTSGTWLTTTGIGLRIYWNLGTGTDNTGTAGAWVGAGNVGADSTVAVISTLNATFYITGVQLEAGSVATPFERRPYSTELQLAQRYFQITNPSNGLQGGGWFGTAWGTSVAQGQYVFPVLMRAAPSFSSGGTNNNFYASGINATMTASINTPTLLPNLIWFELTGTSNTLSIGQPISYNGQMSLSAEL